MSAIPSIASSALSALSRGSALVNRAATQIVSASTSTPQPPSPNPQPDSTTLNAPTTPDSLDLTSSSIPTDPLLAGIRDLMLARLQTSAGIALLHAYADDRHSLLALLSPTSP